MKSANNTMTYQVYLVGGAVRDALLGLDVVDRDWVVTGAIPEQLEQQGYQQVGKQFPVFLHPVSKEEYALARREKKQGQGYTGFICDFSPSISLEEDLERRDLTINAIAQAENGELIDPFHGQQDIANKCLRHVSDAFVEDPLRVLRVARFAARFKEFNFHIAAETMRLMQTISTSGELASLSPERVWRELEKALATSHPLTFFHVLIEAKAMSYLFTELVWPKPPVSETQLLALDKAQRWAMICQHTPLEQLNRLQNALRCPNQYKNLAQQVRSFIEQHAIGMTAEAWQAWLMSVSAIKKPQAFDKLVQVLSLITSTQAKDWQALRLAIAKLNATDLIKQGFSGAELGEALRKERIKALQVLDSPLLKN
ncbi:tRNA nucleotidyltransferase [Marinomonas sp. THO17]|uniref:tRNA nucleotidyltransferase n=1 Tax=Marinomonas sp. THO17 TaxID=3149048 RepID=UPI00336C199A